MKNASANVNREDTNDDIIVTTVEGYMYQIYYDEVTEQKFIEYVGKERSGSLPNLRTNYNKEKATISAEVTNTSDVEVDRIELIYRGEIIETKKGNTVTFSDLQNTGWYMVRVTATSGQMRYAWIRISSTVIAPKIEIISEGKKSESGWYGADQIPLKVRISTDNPTAKAITYFIGEAIEKAEERVEKKEIILEKELQKADGKTVSGTITITAWVDDGEDGNVSETATLQIKYDSIKPVLAETITPNKDTGKTWYTDKTVEISLANSTDNNSGVARYEYKYKVSDEEDTEEEFTRTDFKEVADYKNTPITISKDGIRTIEIVVVDNAGNRSDTKEIQIYKDSTAPTFINDEINITDVKTNSFKINTEATDDISGNPKRDPSYKIMYKYTVKSESGDIVNLTNSVTESKTLLVENLVPNTNYIVTVEATDMAENRSTPKEKQQKTKGELLKPDIKFEPSSPNENGWYNENVKAIITDTATQERTGSKHIVYVITGQSEKIGDARKVETMLEDEGSIDVTAHVIDDEGGSSDTNTKNVKIDKTAPNAPIVTAKSKADGKNNWYKSNVSVEITGISDKEKTGVKEISGADKVTYSIDGKAEETITLTDTSTTQAEIADAITADGEHTIKAYTYDKAGNKSDASAELKINKDAAVPNKAELTVTETDYHTIKVTATGADATSKVASYTFYKSNVSAEGPWDDGVTQTASSNNLGELAYTYEDLDTGTTYWLRVVVTDNAGNTKESIVQRGTTKGDLLAPNIELTSTETGDKVDVASDNTTWRKGTITIKITDSAESTKTSATKIKYQITKGTETVKSETVEGTSITLDTKITTDGTYTITAWAVGRGGTSTPSTRTVKRDTQKPKAPTIAKTKGEETIKDSGWYTSADVEATITAGEDIQNEGVNEVSGKAKIQYTVNGTKQADVTAATATYKLPSDGKFDIIAYTVDNAGNVSDASVTFTIKKDTTKPNKPTLGQKTGIVGENSWYTTEIGIPITAGEDVTPSGVNAVSGKSKVKYTINGSETDAKALTATATITNDGASYEVKAYTVDAAGNISDPETVSGLKKDGTAPIEVSLTQDANGITYNSIKVTAKGKDATSKIASYTFQKSTKSATEGFDTGEKKTANASNLETLDYTYTGLQTGTTYYLRVIVTDNAGKQTTSSVITVKTQGELKAPTITLTSTLDADNMAETSDGTWRKGNITINIKDSGTAGQSSATKIKYQINDETAVTTSSGTTTVDLTNQITADGTYTIKAWAIGRTDSDVSAESSRTVKRDATAPAAPTGSVTTGSKTDNTSEYYTTSSVIVTLTAGADPTPGSGISKIRYKIGSGNTQDVSPTGTGNTYQLSIPNDGTNEITAYTVDGAGNISTALTLTVKKDTQKPNAPTITITNDTKDLVNGWYTKTINIKITAGTDATSGPKKIRYTINGTGNTVTIPTNQNYITTTIENDGSEYKVIAYTIDGAGLESVASATTTVKKDAADPTTATIALQSGVDLETDTISVTATGEDVTSGVASYTFYKSTTSEASGWDNGDTKPSTAKTLNYQYTGLTPNTAYWFKVVVTDAAGHTKESNVIQSKTKSAELTYDELISEEHIGDYVDYQPWIDNWDREKNTGGSVYNGDSDDQTDPDVDYGLNYYSAGKNVTSSSYKNSTVKKTENLKWRVFGKGDKEGEILIISDVATTDTLRLYGYEGYNNGVKLLNDLCKKCYSSKELGTEARSINMEDIDRVSTFKRENYSGYGETSSPTNKDYPNIYAKEKDAIVNNNAGTKESRSTQTEWYTGYSKASTWTTKYTYYYYSMSTTYMTNKYLDLIRYKPGTTTNQTYYWVASRCVYFSSSSAVFNVFYVFSGAVNAYDLFYSGDSRYGGISSVRPVVSIDLQSVAIRRLRKWNSK